METKKVVFSQIEICAPGVIQVRFEKLILDGDKVLSREYHRTSLEPGVPLDAQMAAVNSHLAQMGFPAPAEDVIERVRKIVDAEHTPARVAAFRAAAEARRGRPV